MIRRPILRQILTRSQTLIRKHSQIRTRNTTGIRRLIPRQIPTRTRNMKGTPTQTQTQTPRLTRSQIRI